MTAPVTIPAQAKQALSVLQRHLADSLVAVYLHGSAVKGGLRPNSDVDLLAVINKPVSHEVRRRLAQELMNISHYPARADTLRPLELVIFNRDDLSRLRYPARSEFIFGEWLRQAFESGEIAQPTSDPELTIVLAQARQEATSLLGPDPRELLPAISPDDTRRAIADALPALLGSLDGDERNVLLTLARMWRTMATGEIVSKDAAAEWAIPRLPHKAAGIVSEAREAYLGGVDIDWQVRRQAVRRVANLLRERIEKLA